MLSPVHSTHSVTFKLTVFMSISSLRAWQGLFLVMTSAGLLLPSIHLISAILRLSYNWHKHIKSTMSLFSYVVPSLTKQSYNDFESVQSINGRGLCNCSIFSTIALIAAPTLNPWAIMYSSDARMLYIILLHLMDNQWMILALFLPSMSVMTNSICDERSWLFAKEASVKTMSFKDVMSSHTKQRPFKGLSNYHCICLLSAFVSCLFRLMTWAANDKLNAASGWLTVAM